jgi:hypothetical protein
MHNIGNRLCIRRGARSTAPDRVMDLGKLVGDSVGNVGASRGSAVRSYHEVSAPAPSRSFGSYRPSITPSLKLIAMLVVCQLSRGYAKSCEDLTWKFLS